MIEGIVLAAGSSTRAGLHKIEIPLGNKTLLEHSIAGMSAVCSRIIVVGGYKCERVKEILSSYPAVEVVENPDWQLGMFSSVKVGVRLVASDRFFLLPADVPLVPERVYRSLLPVQSNIVIPVYGGKKGHPVLFGRSMVNVILGEPDDSNLQIVIRRNGYKTVPVDDEAVLLDVDTQADVDIIQKRLRLLGDI